jgi:hypothetical protein
MSSALKGAILETGKLEDKIYTVLTNLATLGTDEQASSKDTPVNAQRKLAKELADAISDGVAKGVQQYLVSSVVTIGTGGPVFHVHNLQAP